MIVLFKILLAHLIGDFLLQPPAWVKEKEEKKLKSPRLYLHFLIHGALLLLFLWDLSLWLPILIITLVHACIDIIKVSFQSPKYKLEWFVADQVMHLIVIVGVWCYWINTDFDFGPIITENRLILITAIVALTMPASVIIKNIISKWAPHTETKEEESLQNAGKYIGILERLFVLAFVVANHWEAVGFLIAAKSVFRFGDLKESKDRKLTEYILIGTLLSFGIALITGMIVRYLMA